MPTALNAAMPPNNPNPPANWRAPEAYITTIRPIMPRTNATGRTMPQMLRTGGTGETIGASNSIFPPPVCARE